MFEKVEGKNLKATDLYVGCELTVNGHTFYLTRSDEATLRYMEGMTVEEGGSKKEGSNKSGTELIGRKNKDGLYFPSELEVKIDHDLY
jgi:hypothetical protein